LNQFTPPLPLGNLRRKKTTDLVLRHSGVYSGNRRRRNRTDDGRSGDLHGGGGDVGCSVMSCCRLLQVKWDGKIGRVWIGKLRLGSWRGRRWCRHWSQLRSNSTMQREW